MTAVISHSPHPRLEDIRSEMWFTGLSPTSTHVVTFERAEGLAKETGHATLPNISTPGVTGGGRFLELGPGSPSDNRDAVSTLSSWWKKLEPKKVRDTVSKANRFGQLTRDCLRDKPEFILLCVVDFFNRQCRRQLRITCLHRAVALLKKKMIKPPSPTSSPKSRSCRGTEEKGEGE